VARVGHLKRLESPTEAAGEPERRESRPAAREAQEPSERPWWRRIFEG
jgi:hypothetical protein